MRTAPTPESEASDLLIRLKLHQRLPIDVERVAQELDILVRYEPFDEDLSGVLIREPQRTFIGVNSSHAITRQRFTIAHEIGHFVLKHKGDLFVDRTVRREAVIIPRDGKSSLGTDLQEVQANRFAAELLMPVKLVSEQITKLLAKTTKPSADTLAGELAQMFKVSSQAMEYRLTNLGYLIPR